MINIERQLFIKLKILTRVSAVELSPGAFRTFVVGTSYQLGNLVSSASSTIESTIGERFPLPPKGTTKRFGRSISRLSLFLLPGSGSLQGFPRYWEICPSPLSRKPEPLTSSPTEYGKVICIFMACVYVYVIALTLLGPEHLSKDFDVSHDEDMAEVAGRTVAPKDPVRVRGRPGSGSEEGDAEKAVARQAE